MTPATTDRNFDPGGNSDIDQRQRRRELAQAFAGVDSDPEGESLAAEQAFKGRAPVAFVTPPPEAPVAADGLTAAGFPMSRAEAQTRQQPTGAGTVERTLDLGDGVTLALRRVPAGEFVMGSTGGAPDERPRAVVRLATPFWMGVTEVTNRQYARFDPQHDTRYN